MLKGYRIYLASAVTAAVGIVQTMDWAPILNAFTSDDPMAGLSLIGMAAAASAVKYFAAKVASAPEAPKPGE
jgi:hypothetical protein